jgi:hypothetical protein
MATRTTLGCYECGTGLLNSEPSEDEIFIQKNLITDRGDLVPFPALREEIDFAGVQEAADIPPCANGHKYYRMTPKQEPEQ